MVPKRASLAPADVIFGAPRPAVASTPDAPSAPRAATSAAKSKYTLLLDADTTLTLMADETELTRRLGKTPPRSNLFRVLLALLHEDETVMAAVVERLPLLSQEQAARGGR